jgi:hypothetical protein
MDEATREMWRRHNLVASKDRGEYSSSFLAWSDQRNGIGS